MRDTEHVDGQRCTKPGTRWDKKETKPTDLLELVDTLKGSFIAHSEIKSQAVADLSKSVQLADVAVVLNTTCKSVKLH